MTAAAANAAVPRHVAVIMDGNGRWAKQRGQPRIFGHRAGAESLRAILRACRDLGLKTIAEFAEDAHILARLREIGVDYAQGDALAPAAPLHAGPDPALR